MSFYGQDFSWLKGMRCTVIGANGFIGTNLCLALASYGALVKACGRSTSARVELGDKVNWVKIDITNEKSLYKVVEDTDFVVHLVSTLLPSPSNLEQIRDIEENLISTLRLLDCCKNSGVKKVIFASSGGTVYGPQQLMPINEKVLPNPICSYGIVKAAVENYLNLYRRLNALDFVALRISNPFGAYQMPHDQGLVAALIGKVLTSAPIDIWGDGTVIRDYIYIDDLVSAIILAMALQDPKAPRIYNVGSGVGRSVNEVLSSVEAIHGALPEVRYSPQRDVDVPVNMLDITLAREYLGWYPRVEWNIALKETYGWLNSVLN